MPIFDFQCEKCSHRFEMTLVLGNKDIPACPACGSKKTEKLITPPTIVFRGKGFYATDRKKGAQPRSSDVPNASGDTSVPPTTEKGADTSPPNPKQKGV